MSNHEGETDSQQPLQLINAAGSPITVGRRDRVERIREALTDIQLVIDGCANKPPERLAGTVASLARNCSIFLRKMVLGDDRSPRLLSDEFMQEVELVFSRIQSVSGNRREISLGPPGIARGRLQITKINEETDDPEDTHFVPFGPQQLKIVVEWPLPGMADWLNQPTSDAPWTIRPEGLFESQLDHELDCDRWLGQQIVIFDKRGVSLKDIIRVTVNTEAAHSPPLERLMVPEGSEDKARFRVIKDREIHILSHITVCGVRYSHALVIQAAMFLYRELAGQSSIGLSESKVGIPVFGFTPDDVFSPSQNWLRFDGGLVISLGDTGQSITHRVRAPR